MSLPVRRDGKAIDTATGLGGLPYTLSLRDVSFLSLPLFPIYAEGRAGRGFSGVWRASPFLAPLPHLIFLI